MKHEPAPLHPRASGQNKLSRDQAERAAISTRISKSDYSTKFGKQAAEAMASEEAVKRLEAEAAQQKRQAALQVTAQQDIARTCAGSRATIPAPRLKRCSPRTTALRISTSSSVRKPSPTSTSR
jgi:hypothetical protein